MHRDYNRVLYFEMLKAYSKWYAAHGWSGIGSCLDGSSLRFQAAGIRGKVVVFVEIHVESARVCSLIEANRFDRTKMDLTKIIEALQATLIPDQQPQAEEYLKQVWIFYYRSAWLIW